MQHLYFYVANVFLENIVTMQEQSDVCTTKTTCDFAVYQEIHIYSMILVSKNSNILLINDNFKPENRFPRQIS